ncbi:unnamed protein product [Phytomonas sp. EM1]|nr:unnamed protein product [Phytomonas sp. EM1]|eukprot:CCW62205.1 unnamed protein product [Phytomonas sp. isolate EM1]
MPMKVFMRYKSDSQESNVQMPSEDNFVFDCDHDTQSFTEHQGTVSPLQKKSLNEQEESDEWFELLFYDSPSNFDAEHSVIDDPFPQEQPNESRVSSVYEKESEAKDTAITTSGVEKDNEADGGDNFFLYMHDSDNEAVVEGTATSQETGEVSLAHLGFSEEAGESNILGDSFCVQRDADAGSVNSTVIKQQEAFPLSHEPARKYSSSIHLLHLDDDYEASGPCEGLFHDLEESAQQDWSAHCKYNEHFSEHVPDTQDGDEAHEEGDLHELSRSWQRKSVQVSFNEVEVPLKIPDKAGHIVEEATTVGMTKETQMMTQDNTGKPASASATPNSNAIIPTLARMMDGQGYLSQQDKLYLAPQPLAELRLDEECSRTRSKMCVLVVFAANDLRVHDNYNLALASMRAYAAGGLPVVALCVLDYRTFAQPSLVGGFFRQSPQRAQFLLDTVAALRRKLEDSDLRVPLLIRCGRPEEHVPRLVVELGAVDVFLTTQYAPHERRVHDYILQRIKKRCWVSRRVLQNGDFGFGSLTEMPDRDESTGEELVEVVEHTDRHPYMSTRSETELRSLDERVTVHSVWQSTLVHLDDLQTPVAAMKEGERWYHDDVTTAVIRPTKPYNWHISRLKDLPVIAKLLPSERERLGLDQPSLLRGRLPTLEELGYGDTPRLFRFEEVIATQSSHPTAGEDAAIERVEDWLDQGGMTSMMRFARMRRTNTKMYSQKLSRVSPYIATGALSPRKFYEMLRTHTHANLRDGFVQMQYREALLRLSRRDYWHWMGLRYGDRLFFPYGPHPEETDGIADWRHDGAIVQKWCMGLTGIPFTDAAMRELLGTGFVAHEGRQALVWLLTRGYGQDWRLAAEWLERCSLDFDPFVCYGNCAYFSELMHDDFGEPVRNVHFLAHHHDQTGIYIKKWLPQLSKIPPVYIHRPHILTPRMQAMHGVYIGKNYPYPLKLWQGAHRALTSADLKAYFPDLHNLRGPGYAEAARHGMALMQPEEWNHAFNAASIRGQPWMRGSLFASAFEDVVEEENVAVVTHDAKSTASAMDKTLFASESFCNRMSQIGAICN